MGNNFMNQFAKNLKSLSRTQKRLAKQYDKWADEGGRDAARCASEAQRLKREAIKHAELAERELNR